ncbi:MAG: glutamate formimidoyltransferase [Armatimonadota bacterium]|nr:glutamate formimidoyltransferase [Armatimonadota bacterium]MDR7401343.1 glutamate formimidoyltransferase [Armatimonadota bacterium]MDR7404471.1 glutamate formimidoyltransferase [Armatimonadota bacterium]MDR7437478.1 glutamate formimidoyltransferase [Armatimonadota bacterium]MDR7472357.1 glutamate formimidoyltransferase [Armatimonadota bacterium]
MSGILVECVPNFSEGRRRDVIEAIAEEVRRTPGARLLDVQADESHNRCVLSFVGDLEAVTAAALAAARRAVELIDMRVHRGEHPRLGAVDVIPLVPIAGVTMEHCVAAARELGRRLWEELRVPVYFYAEAATRPERRRLPDIRKGEFEGLAAKMADPAWAPDVGDPHPHPTAGAVVVGARRPLIAFNVNLTTTDVEVAKRVARAVRESSGGLVNVQAMGVTSEGGQAQVSMNLLDHTRTPLYRAFELVRTEAARYGVEIQESEVVGLIPLDAVADVARFYLRLRDFRRDQILEAKLME